MPAEHGGDGQSKQTQIDRYFSLLSPSTRSPPAVRPDSAQDRFGAQALRRQARRVNHIVTTMAKVSSVKYQWETHLELVRKVADGLQAVLGRPRATLNQLDPLLAATALLRNHLQARTIVVGERGGTSILVPTVTELLTVQYKNSIATEEPRRHAYRCLAVTIATLGQHDQEIDILEKLITKKLEVLQGRLALVHSMATSEPVKHAVLTTVTMEEIPGLLLALPEDDPAFQDGRASLMDCLERGKQIYIEGHPLDMLDQAMMKCCLFAAKMGMRIARQSGIEEYFHRR